MKLTIDEAKKRIDLPAYLAQRWPDCGARPGKPGTIKAAWRGEQNGSVQLEQRDGVWLWKDYATGEGGSIVDLLIAADGLDKKQAIAQAIELAGGSAVEPAPRSEGKSERWNGWRPAGALLPSALPPDAFSFAKIGTLASTWRYLTADGRLAFVVARYHKPDGGKELMPWTVWVGAGGALKWRAKGYPAPRPLYGLPDLAARPGLPVLIVEGEKAADSARALLPAYAVTTWPSGARGVGQADWSAIAGRHVWIWPDNDEPGIEAAVDVARACSRAGASSVRVVELPEGLPPKWDLADPMPPGLDPDAVLKAAPAWNGDDQAGDRPTDDADAPLEGYQLEHEEPTELGMAIKFARLHRSRVRFVSSLGWMVWDGARFAPDNGQVQEIVTAMILALRPEAVEMRRRAGALQVRSLEVQDNIEESRRLFNEAHALEAKIDALLKAEKNLGKHSKIRGILAQAQSKPGIRSQAEDFDRDPWLLNVANGIVDLRSGELRPHDPADAMTKLAGVAFDPRAIAPTWEKFIHDAFGGDADLIRFVRQLIGYALTGDTREQKFLILEGTGGNGKGVFLDTIIDLMGDYARTLRKEAVILRVNGDSQGDADLANLPGARLVSVNELGDGDRLNASRLKEMCGGERISANPKFLKPFEYQPSFKLWIRTNHLPEAKVDTALADRIVRVPFRVRFRGTALEDKTLKERLRAELPGILNWAIVGARDWMQHGLVVPQAVATATAEYVAEQDPIGRWIEQLELRPRMEAGRLHEAFAAWCREEGAKELSAIALGKALTAKGWGMAWERNGTGRRVRVRIPPAQLFTDSAESFVPPCQSVPAETLMVPILARVGTDGTNFPPTLPSVSLEESFMREIGGKCVPTRANRANGSPGEFPGRRIRASGTGSAAQASDTEEGEL